MNSTSYEIPFYAPNSAVSAAELPVTFFNDNPLEYAGGSKNIFLRI